MIRLALLLFLAIPADGEETIALVNARILPVKGDPIAKGVVLVRNGKIAAVGADLPVPEGARVIDLSGKTVIPTARRSPPRCASWTPSTRVRPTSPAAASRG